MATEPIDWWAVAGGVGAGFLNPFVGIGTYAAIEAENDAAAERQRQADADRAAASARDRNIRRRKEKLGRDVRRGSRARSSEGDAAGASSGTSAGELYAEQDDFSTYAIYGGGALLLLLLLLPVPP
jgi:hypothetical protein